MILYVDADACPVKAEVQRVAARHKVAVKLVCNGGLRPVPDPLVEVVVVPDGPDVADMWIAERAGPGDICITGDLPLAARCIEAGAQVLTHKGEVLDARNIGPRLATRDLMADLRAADPFLQGSGRPFGKADRSRFMDLLDRQVRAGRRAGA
ncbi:MAG: YaiI/YqxD family protein [Pseudomonadota bacterium]